MCLRNWEARWWWLRQEHCWHHGPYGEMYTVSKADLGMFSSLIQGLGRATPTVRAENPILRKWPKLCQTISSRRLHAKILHRRRPVATTLSSTLSEPGRSISQGENGHVLLLTAKDSKTICQIETMKKRSEVPPLDLPTIRLVIIMQESCSPTDSASRTSASDMQIPQIGPAAKSTYDQPAVGLARVFLRICRHPLAYLCRMHMPKGGSKIVGPFAPRPII